MTLAEAQVAINLQCPWFGDRDLAAFLAMPPEEQELIIRAYQGAGVPAKGPSSFETFMLILSAVSQIAGLVIPILGAVGVANDLRKNL